MHLVRICGAGGSSSSQSRRHTQVGLKVPVTLTLPTMQPHSFLPVTTLWLNESQTFSPAHHCCQVASGQRVLTNWVGWSSDKLAPLLGQDQNNTSGRTSKLSKQHDFHPATIIQQTALTKGSHQ